MSGEQKKIIYIVNKLSKAGAEKQLLLIIQALSKKYEMAIIVLKGQGNFDEDFKKYVPLYYFSLPSLLNLKSLNAFIKLVSFLRQWRPDIVHSWLYHSNITAGLISVFLRKGTTLIASERNTLFWVKKRHDFVYSIVFRLVDRVLVNSHFIKTDLDQRYGIAQKVAVIPNGIDLNIDIESIDPCVELMNRRERGEIIIGCVGRFATQKRQIDVIVSAKRLLEKHKYLFFVFVGNGPTFNDCVAAAGKYQIEKHVLFAGAVSNAFPYMKNFDILVQASTSEGMPNVIMEAMFLGIPIVATDVGGTGMLVEEGFNGYLVEPLVPDDLEERIDKLIVDNELRKKFAANSKEKIKEYSLENMTRKISVMYDSIQHSRG